MLYLEQSNLGVSIKKNKKKQKESLPTDPIFFGHATGNTVIFFFFLDIKFFLVSDVKD